MAHTNIWVHLAGHQQRQNLEVLMTMGAGDIDTLIEPIKKLLTSKND